MTRAPITREQELEELARNQWGLVAVLATVFVSVVAIGVFLLFKLATFDPLPGF